MKKMNKWKWIVGGAVALALLGWGLSALAVAPADYGLHEGDVIRASGDPDIYIVNDAGYKRLFVNPAIFNLYGHLGWDKVKEVSPAVRDAFATSGLFRNCETNDGKVFGLEVASEDVANLHWVSVSGAQAVAEDPAFFQKVFCINSAEQALYGSGANYTSLSQIPDYSRGGNVTPPVGGGTLHGGAGELVKATFVSSLNNESVGEGENNVKVAGLVLEADNGSDIRLMSVKLEFVQNDTGSKRLSHYADSVSVWLGDTKLASVLVSDFNKDGDFYSKSVSLPASAVIDMDSSEKLYVAVSANDSIDSDDLANNDWDVTVTSLRYVDAEGSITSETGLDDIGSARGFMFESYADAAELELKLTESTDNPESQAVVVDDVNGKSGVVLLSGNLKAIGGDLTVKEVSVDVTPALAPLTDIAQSFTLEIDGDEVQSIDSSDCVGVVCEFDDVDFVINEGDTVNVRVLTDVNGTDESAEGASLTASLDSNDIVVEDQNEDEMNNLTGVVSGEEQAFFSQGIDVQLASVNFVKSYSHGDTVGDADQGTATFNFKVTAFGDDMFVDKDSFTLGTTGSVALGFPIAQLNSNADEGVNTFKVDEGSTENFELAVIVEAAADGFFKVSLDGLKYDVSDVNGSLDYTFNLDDFETNSLYLSVQ